MTPFLERLFGAPRQEREQRLPEPGWAARESAAGFYCFHYPADWQLTHEGSELQVRPPHGSAVAVLSAVYGRATRPPQLERWLCGAFETCQPKTKPKLLERQSWIGFRQDFGGEDHGQPIEWLAEIGWVPSAVVLLAVRDSPQGMQAHGAIYEQILASLELRNPKPPRNRR